MAAGRNQGAMNAEEDELGSCFQEPAPRAPNARTLLQFSPFAGVDEGILSPRGRFRRCQSRSLPLESQIPSFHAQSLASLTSQTGYQSQISSDSSKAGSTAPQRACAQPASPKVLQDRQGMLQDDSGNALEQQVRASGSREEPPSSPSLLRRRMTPRRKQSDQHLQAAPLRQSSSHRVRDDDARFRSRHSKGIAFKFPVSSRRHRSDPGSKADGKKNNTCSKSDSYLGSSADQSERDTFLYPLRESAVDSIGAKIKSAAGSVDSKGSSRRRTVYSQSTDSTSHETENLTTLGSIRGKEQSKSVVSRSVSKQKATEKVSSIRLGEVPCDKKGRAKHGRSISDPQQLSILHAKSDTSHKNRRGNNTLGFADTTQLSAVHTKSETSPTREECSISSPKAFNSDLSSCIRHEQYLTQEEKEIMIRKLLEMQKYLDDNT